MKKPLNIAKWGCYFVVLSTYLFLSCGKEKKHEGLLSEQEMAHVIIDNYLKEAKIMNAKVSADSIALLLRFFEHSSFKKEGIPDSIMKVSFSYYLAHPEELGKILDIVIDTLSLKEERFNQTRKTDSLAVTTKDRIL